MTYLQSPGHHHFKAGQAVFYLGQQRQKALFTPIPAIIAKDDSSWIQWPDGHVSSVGYSTLVYRGYCPHCPVPAVLDVDQQLVCPQCGTAAIDCPPPDDLIIRWFPMGMVWVHMTAQRAAAHPTWTWKQARQDARAALTVIDQRTYSLAEQLGLPRPKWSMADDQYPMIVRMRFYAFLGDTAAYLEAYHELAHVQRVNEERTNRRLNVVDSLLDLILAEDVFVKEQERRKAQRAAADSTPDGADELTDWLERQFRKAA